MMGPTHRLLGASAHLAVTPLVTDLPPWMILATVPVAVLAAAGRLSPDMDLWLPVAHRTVTHWPETAAALTWLAWWQLPPWLAVPAAAGWCSHVAGDWLYGGVPFLVLGGRRRRGFRLDTDGITETGKWRGRRLLPFGPAQITLQLVIVVQVLAVLGWLTPIVDAARQVAQ